ncbi:hypothetical protein MML48_1g04735 [Holotrichia oblita]|uniref:Uncharacterized protein n=1 Tax=Holotrichia oblita TaxID=644536 RepID=A0ACB9TUL0_HOLOL|nr:hypothetical protein MML48_1g04735 [Holotrichia oblita]
MPCFPVKGRHEANKNIGTESYKKKNARTLRQSGHSADGTGIRETYAKETPKKCLKKPTNLLDAKDSDLVNEFVDFLRNDKELSTALKNEFGSHPSDRRKRQTELDDMNINLDEIPQEKQDGFFDRATKFMMELLQRFLKWINTD